MDVKTVLLDIDGTVMDFSKGQKNAFYETCLSLGYPINDALYSRFDGINKHYWGLFERGAITKSALVIERFKTYFAETGLPGDEYAAEEIYQELLGEQCFFIEGALDAVKYLSSKYPVHAVTNGVGRTQRSRLARSGLTAFIDRLFISEEVGAGKPSKEFFDYVFRSLPDAERAASVIIGDSQSSDIKGGLDAGLKTVWFASDGAARVTEPDAVIYRWEEIYDLL